MSLLGAKPLAQEVTVSRSAGGHRAVRPVFQKGRGLLRVPAESPSNQKRSLSPPDPDAEVCLHALRLVQSVVLEPEVFSKSASEFRSSLPLQRIVAMAKSRNPHLQTAAQELLEDLRALERDA